MQATATKMMGICVMVSQHEVFEDVLSEFLEDVKDYVMREERYIKDRKYEYFYYRNVYLYIPEDIWKKIKRKYSKVKHYNVVERDYDYFLMNYWILEDDEIERVKKDGNKITVYAYVMDYEINENAIKSFEKDIKEKGYLFKKTREETRLYSDEYVIRYGLYLTLREWEDLLYEYEDLIGNYEEVNY